MSWAYSSSAKFTRSYRSGSLTTSSGQSTLSTQSSASLQTSSASTMSSTESINSSTSETSSTKPQTISVQKLYLLLPNHKCPNKKNCPFHPPEEEEEALEVAEVTLVNKRRAMSLASHEMITEQLLADKLAKINQQISSNLLDGNKLHFPRKTSHDISLATADIERLRFDHYSSETVPGAGSTREESVASDYDLDSGVTFDSCSDREMDEESLPLIQEEVVVPDIVITEKFQLKSEDGPDTDQQQDTDAQATLQINEVIATETTEVQETSVTIAMQEHIIGTQSQPRFLKELEYLTVTEGSLVRLDCVVTGNPQPDIRWFKNNSPIDDAAGYKTESTSDGTSSLIIERACVEDSGSFKCVAVNSSGSATTESKIRVQKAVEEQPPVNYQLPEVKEVQQHSQLAPPEFTTTLKNRTAPEGVTVRLTCSVVGIPQPKIRWFKDDKEVFDGLDFKFTNYGELSSLEVKYVKQSLAGKYKVEASNSEGTVSCSCVLEVEGDETIEEMELDFQRPKFIRKIEDVHVREGEDATFTCTATGKPMPTFKWQKDMINITASDRVEMESNSQGHGHLTLKKVRPSDNGLYYCVAHSKAGRVKCTAYLHVKAKSSSPVAKKQKHQEEHIEVQAEARKEGSVERGRCLGSPPSLELLLPDSLDIVVGGRLKLDCSVQGYPMPLVTWHKGDRGLMYSQRHRIIACGSLHTMEIPQVMALDTGEYIVRATNIYGTLQSSCYVNILPGGSKFSLSDYERPAVITVTKEYLQAPFFVKHLPKFIDAVLGMNIRLDCVLRDKIELVEWSKSPAPAKEVETVKKDLVDEGFHGEFIPSQTRPREHEAEDKKLSEVDKKRSTDLEEKITEPVSFTQNLSNVEQQVGNDAVFECTTAGDPGAEIKWYKNGQRLATNDRVRITSTGNKHTLRIVEVRGSDAGEYVCQASGQTGTKSSGAFLAVSDISERRSHVQTDETEEVPSIESPVKEQSARQDKYEVPVKAEKPSFIEPLRRITSANQGDDVELVCQLTTPDILRVKWELDGQEVPSEAKYVTSSDEDSHQHKLVITSVTEGDSGKYTCVAYLKDGDILHTSTKLNVAAAKQDLEQKTEDYKPRFSSQLQDTVVRDGEGLVLECDIEGNPRPQISWFRDGLEILDSQDFQISTIGSHCKLQIHDIYPEDEGRYSCRAVNNLGEDISSCYVSVEDLGEDMSPDSASTASSKSYDKARARRGEAQEGDLLKKKTKKGQEKPEVPPELVVKPRRQFVDESSNAKFKASFDGPPSTVLFWSKDAQILSNSDHFQMYEADGFHFLEVQKVSADDIGMYSVTVQNLAGSDTAEAELEVFEKPKLLSRSGPEWEQALQDVVAEEGDVGVELVCTSRDLVQPSVRWFHSGKEIFSGFHMKLQHVAQTATLSIKEIRERDAGEFKCVMTGKNGELETSCNLIIKSPEQLEPPVFVKELHDMEVEEGDKLELDVEVKGTPPLKVCWYHNNLEIIPGSAQYLISSAGRTHTLTQLNASTESSGEYVCEAFNDMGSADTFCFIEVREVEHPEPPDFVVHPSNLAAHEGETATFTCQVKGQPTPSVLWKKEGAVIVNNQKFKITRIGDRHTLKIDSLDPADAGEYTCCLRNTEGETFHKCWLDVVEPKHSARYQAADTVKTRRPPTTSNMEEMSQFSSKTTPPHEKRPMTSSEITNDYKAQTVLRREDEIENTQAPAARITQTSFETSVEMNTLHHLSQSSNRESNSDSRPNHVRNMTEHTELSKTSAESITNVHLPPHSMYQEMEKSRHFSNSELMDSRRSLHPHKSMAVQPGELTLLSNETDFKRVTLTNNTNETIKTDLEVENVKAQVLTSELKSNIVPSRAFTSDVHPSSSLSSRLSSLSREKKDYGQVKDLVYKLNDTTNDTEPAVLKLNGGTSTLVTVSSASAISPTQTAAQSWRRPSKGNSSSSSTYRHFSPVDGTTDFNKVPEELKSTSRKTGNSLFQSEVQVVDTRTRETRSRTSSSSSTEDCTMISGAPSTSSARDPRSDNYHVSQRSSLAVKSAASTHGSPKVNLLQLSACKVSISEFNPSEPQSDASKLEVTSITASVPLRQSLSSTGSNSESPSVRTSRQYDAHIRQKDDNVFTMVAKEGNSTEQESGQIFKGNEAKYNLQTVYKVNKLSWNNKDDKNSSHLDNYAYDKINNTNDKEKSTTQSRTRFSEKFNTSRNSNHQESRSAYRLSTVSRHEVGPGSNATVLGYGAPSAQLNEVDDFRSIKLKPTASKGKDSSDLSKSKYMSKSTESIFTDVRLKPVLKTDDNWKRSELASNADRIRASSKSSDLSKLLPSSSYLSSIKNKPVAATFSSLATPPRTAISNTGTSPRATISTTSPRATISTTSTTSKFIDSLKVFAGDDRSKLFNQSARYSKSTQSSKLRASSGKHEKVSSGGVTRSNSHRKSKGIGAKFEAAIKDMKSTQVPYSSLQLTKNRTAVKPSVTTNSTEYISKRDSNQHHGKPAEGASAEKGWIQPASKYSPANAVLNSNGDSYLDKVSEWAKKRQSLHVDAPSTSSLDKKSPTDSKIQSTVTLEKSQYNSKNQEANELNNISTAIPNEKQDAYSIKTNVSNKQSAVRIRNRPESRNLQENSGASWLGLQGSQDNRNARQFQEDHAGIPRLNTGHKISHSDQDATSRFKDFTQAMSGAAADSTTKPIEVNMMRPLPPPLPKQSALSSNEPVTYNQLDMPAILNSTSSGDRTTGTYKSQIVMVPKSAVSTKPSSTIVTLPRTKSAGEIAALASQPTETVVAASTNLASTGESVSKTVIPQVSFTSVSTTMEMKSSLLPGKTYQPADTKMQLLHTERSSIGTSHANNLKSNSEVTSVEGFSEKQSPLGENGKESFLGNSGSSWTQQRSRRPIPVYPVNDNELFHQTEMDISSTTDLDSIISTTSMSSSSSDASNVTADSGIPRRPTGIWTVNENLHPDSWTRQAGADKHHQPLKYPIDNNQEIKKNLWETAEDMNYVQKPNIYKRNTNNEDFLTEQKNDQSQRNKQGVLKETVNETAASNPVKQAEQENEHTEVYGYKAFRRDVKEAGHTSSNISEENAPKYTSVSTESKHSAGLKEDLVSEPIPRSEYISRRQRRQLENQIVATSHTVPKLEINEIRKGRFSDSNPSDIVTSKESLLHNPIPVSYEQSSREKSQSKTENIFSSSHSKRTETIDEQNVSNLGRVRKPQVDTDSASTFEDVHSERHVLNASKSVDAVLHGLSAAQGGYMSTSGRSNDLNEPGQISNSHLNMSDQISTTELRQRWRNSRQQKTNTSLEKSSAGSDYVARTQAQSTTGAISVSTSAPLDTKSTSYTFSTPGASLPGAHCPPSFPIPLQDVTVMNGSPAVLRCQVIGNPRPDVKWLLNQKPVEVSGKIDIIYHDCIAQLSITETSREHQGDFTCCAKNSQGTVSSHCTLHLIDDPSQNLSCQTEQAVPGSDAAKMSDILTPSNDPEKTIINITTGKAAEAPAGKPYVSAKDSHSVSLSWPGCTSRHETEVVYYIIEGKEAREKAWEIFIAQCKLFPCLVEGLKPGTSYHFRVLAANKHGVSPASEPSEAVTTFDSPTLTDDFEYEGELPFKPREVQINTTANFEDLYDKDKEVGKGKFGVVYKCRQRSDGSVWAAKVVRCREKEKVNLRREIAIMNKLHHPKLLLLWDAFESPRQMVLVMEYIGAGELFERVIGDDYILTENDCIHFVRQICEGLAYMHSQSILHLDLKPENILCVAEHSNRIKIIDFGLAQFYTPGQGTKVLFGTPEFIAPEVINYDEISFATDMWSLGVICYVLLSGLSPFLGDSDAETLASVTTGEYDFDDDAFDEISDVAKDFISKLLVKKKEKRMLTEHCLAHPWLSQDEVDGIHGKRLNTERLKKFMIRRKWLKTGNAVKAVSRLMKSNSLTGFGISLQHSSNLTEATPTNITAPESPLQKTELSDNEDDDYNDSHTEFNSTENDIISEISQNLHSIDNSFQSVEENGSSVNIESNFNTTGIFCDSQEGYGVSSERVINSVEETSAEFVSQVIPRRQREATSEAEKTKPWISSRALPGASERMKSLNKDLVKSEAYSASSTPRTSNNSPPTSSLTAGQRTSEESAQGSRISLQSSNRRTEGNEASRLTDDKNQLQAPIFTKPMIRCKTYTGDVARFDVRVSGEPVPRVTWFFEDEEIISDTRHVLSLNETTRSFSLIIRNVEEDDEGEYTCKAVNSLGESSCSAELVVLVF